MIRVVLDANVIVSGFPAQSGTLMSVIDYWREQRYELIVSEHILDEVERAWNQPYWRSRFSQPERDLAISLINRRATLAPATEIVQNVATHPEGDLVLAAAVSADVEYLVTGDQQLLKLSELSGVVILSPRAFLDKLDSERE